MTKVMTFGKKDITGGRRFRFGRYLHVPGQQAIAQIGSPLRNISGELSPIFQFAFYRLAADHPYFNDLVPFEQVNELVVR